MRFIDKKIETMNQIKQEIFYTLCKLAELPELNPKYTRLSNLSDCWSKYKKYLPIVLVLYVFFFTLIFFIFTNNPTPLWAYLLIIYLYLIPLFPTLLGILESEKQSRELPRKKIIKAGQEARLDLERLEKLKFVKQISNKKVIIEEIANKVSLKALNEITKCFESLEKKLKDRINVFSIFLVILGFFIPRFAIYILNVPTEFLEIKILNNTKIIEIIGIFVTSLLLYLNTRPSQTQQMYEQCLTVLKQARDKKDENSEQRQFSLTRIINKVKSWFK